MKAIYLLPLLPSLLLLGGCDDSDPEVCRYYVQQDLDTGNYSSAITRIEDEKCQDTYPGNEYLVDLGTAYLGKSGFTLPKIMGSMLEDENNANEDQFETFAEDMTTSFTDDTLNDLTHSRGAFTRYLGDRECKDIVDPSSTQNGICLLTGFVDILKTTVAIDSLAGGDIGSWTDDEPTNDGEMLRSTCALQYANDHKNDSQVTIPYSKCSKDASVDASLFVTFTAADGTTKDYNSLSVSSQGKTSYFLESEKFGSTVFTKGFCRDDYSACEDPAVQGCYVCPSSQSPDDPMIKDFVLDSLNKGFDNIEKIILDNAASDDDELKESINDFRSEIKSGGCEQTPAGEDCFTVDDIIDYLNKKQ